MQVTISQPPPPVPVEYLKLKCLNRTVALLNAHAYCAVANVRSFCHHRPLATLATVSSLVHYVSVITVNACDISSHVSVFAGDVSVHVCVCVCVCVCLMCLVIVVCVCVCACVCACVRACVCVSCVW